MPAKTKNDTLGRLLELLQAIPHRRFASPDELAQALNSRGYPVTVRTVQRDLQMLREHLPLEVRDDSKPHGWGWKHQPPDGVAGMGASEALMVALVERHLLTALPASLFETFRPTFERARRRLERLGTKAGTASWLDKVATVQPALVGRIPRSDRRVREVIAEALLLERQLDCEYSAFSGESPAQYRLHPLGLVLRAGVLYLMATKGSGSKPAFFALHRFTSASVRLERVAHEPGVTLASELQRTGGQFGVPSGGKHKTSLHLVCDGVLARYLEESPLSDDQLVSIRSDGEFDVHATVPDSWELRWWLISRSASVEVASPPKLRSEVAQALRNGLGRYER